MGRTPASSSGEIDSTESSRRNTSLADGNVLLELLIANDFDLLRVEIKRRLASILSIAIAGCASYGQQTHRNCQMKQYKASGLNEATQRAGIPDRPKPAKQLSNSPAQFGVATGKPGRRKYSRSHTSDRHRWTDRRDQALLCEDRAETSRNAYTIVRPPWPSPLR